MTIPQHNRDHIGGEPLSVADALIELEAALIEASFNHSVFYSVFPDWATFMAFIVTAPRPFLVNVDTNIDVTSSGGLPWDLGTSTADVTFDAGNKRFTMTFDESAQIEVEGIAAFRNVGLTSVAFAAGGLVCNNSPSALRIEGDYRNKPIAIAQQNGAPILTFGEPLQLTLINAQILNQATGIVVGNGGDNNLSLVLGPGAQIDPFTVNIANPVDVVVLSNNDVTAVDMTNQTWSSPSVASRTIDTVFVNTDQYIIQVTEKMIFADTSTGALHKIQPPYYPYDGQMFTITDWGLRFGADQLTIDGTLLPNGATIQDWSSPYSFSTQQLLTKDGMTVTYRYSKQDNTWRCTMRSIP